MGTKRLVLSCVGRTAAMPCMVSPLGGMLCLLEGN